MTDSPVCTGEAVWSGIGVAVELLQQRLDGGPDVLGDPDQEAVGWLVEYDMNRHSSPICPRSIQFQSEFTGPSETSGPVAKNRTMGASHRWTIGGSFK